MHTPKLPNVPLDEYMESVDRPPHRDGSIVMPGSGSHTLAPVAHLTVRFDDEADVSEVEMLGRAGSSQSESESTSTESSGESEGEYD